MLQRSSFLLSLSVSLSLLVVCFPSFPPPLPSFLIDVSLINSSYIFLAIRYSSALPSRSFLSSSALLLARQRCQGTFTRHSQYRVGINHHFSSLYTRFFL
uniref:Secreted protein n=1 Tax=Cacopsylla melanoneura TaxID=428564 RepID=A0A8D8ZSN2_9HEMI